jgi:hypothetical protein
MKVFQVALLAISASTSLAASSLRAGDEERKLAIANCPGTESFSVSFAGTCDDASLQAAITQLKSTEFTSCTADAATILNDLLGTDNNNRAAKVETICRAAYEDPDFNFSFDDVTLEGFQFNNEYFSGGGKWNYEIQTDDGDNVLRQDAARVNKIYQNEAVEKAITLPMDLPAFNPSDVDKCELNAAFCCWVQDRQARDNNGNCGTPYSTNCVDKDPGDNANLCYVEHEKAAVATHMAGGFSIYGDVKRNKENIEGSIHCHGFAWAEDDLDSISVFKGNNLFYVSMYDHMHQRGYVRNVPGATMCACAENMPVVTRSDCTQVDVELSFEFTYDSGSNAMTASVEVTDFEFNACQGANNKNNDLEAYYKKLVNTGKATQANLEKLQKILVGAGGRKCDAAIESFLASKGIVLK